MVTAKLSGWAKDDEQRAISCDCHATDGVTAMDTTIMIPIAAIANRMAEYDLDGYRAAVEAIIREHAQRWYKLPVSEPKEPGWLAGLVEKDERIPLDRRKRRAMLRLVQADPDTLTAAQKARRLAGIAYLTALKRARMGGLRAGVTVEGIPAEERNLSAGLATS